MKKTWTVHGALDMGLQALGDHLEHLEQTPRPDRDWLWTRMVTSSVKALVELAAELREAADPRNASKEASVAQLIAEAVKEDPSIRLEVEAMLREGRAS